MAKKKRQLFRNKSLPVLCVLITAAFLAAGSAFAYLADADSAQNNISVGAVDTDIIEEFPDSQKPVPGGNIVKKVSIKNNGPNSCYVRVQILFSDSLAERYCTVNYPDLENWEFSEGWWYYKKILDCNEVTTELMDGLTVSEDYPFDGPPEFEIYVRQEAVQSEGHASARDAFESMQDRKDSV